MKPIDPQINNAAKILEKGGVIAYPTDTLYGLGCDVTNHKAVEKIYNLKGRDYQKPLAIACCDFKMAREYVVFDNRSTAITHHFLPGPYMVIIKREASISDIITAGSDFVGLRIPDHQLCLQIIKKFGKPIITTSANISGQRDPVRASKVKLDVDLVVEGECRHKKASTIIDIAKMVILREGAGVDKAKRLIRKLSGLA
jgi:L-threonylcarbamoyladenylate synthase